MHSREINLHPHYYNKPKKYFIQHYKSGSGIEYFISLESLDKKVLFGFVRLRLTRSKPMFDGLQYMGLIRELHVYNPVKSKGVGKQLLKYAEWISWIHGKNGVVVMSSEGYRSYYSQLGYSYHETFEIKKWQNIYITIYLILSYVYILLYSYIKYFK
jgi:histone acetyltransferase (RNA polymerase elongator complex component)